MKRRKFLLASGSTILTGTALSSLQRPALGLEFKLSAVPDEKPANIDSILVEFTNFEMTPSYLNESSGLDITVELEIEGETPRSKNISGLSFKNGQTIDSDYIQNKTGKDLAKIAIDQLDRSASNLQGDVYVKVNHQDISQKSYHQSFEINSDEIPIWEQRVGIIDDFEDFDMVEYSFSSSDGGLEASDYKVQNSVVQEDTYALELVDSSGKSENINSISMSGLPRYPKAGDTFESYVRTENTSSSGTWVRFGVQSNGFNPDGYSVSIARGDGFELGIFQQGSYTVLASDTVSLSVDTWYRIEIVWGEGGSITANLYETDGSKIATASTTNTKYIDGGFGWRHQCSAGGNESSFYDSAEITDTTEGTGVIDDFEDNNLNKYNPDSTTFSVTNSNPYSGSYSLESVHDKNNGGLFSISGLPRYPQAGDEFSVLLYNQNITNSNQSFWWCTNSSNELPDNAYWINLNSRNSLFELKYRNIGGDGQSTIASEPYTFSSNTWYKIKIDHQKDGTITCTLYESGSKGPTISDKNTAYEAGGIGYYFASKDTTQDVQFWDLAEINSSGDKLHRGTIDDFERGDLSPYEFYDTSSELKKPAIVQTPVYEGSYVAEYNYTNSNAALDAVSLNGLERYPAAGDTTKYEIYLDSQSSDGVIPGIIFAVQESVSQPGGYKIRYREDTGNLELFKRDTGGGGSLTSLDSKSVSFPRDQWVEMRVEWQARGIITVTLYDKDQNNLVTLQGDDNAYQQGGIAFTANSTDNNKVLIRYDGFEIL